MALPAALPVHLQAVLCQHLMCHCAGVLSLQGVAWAAACHSPGLEPDYALGANDSFTSSTVTSCKQCISLK